MKHTLLILILIIFASNIKAQKNTEQNETVKSYFLKTREAFPDIPKGLLEAVAYTNTRFTHIDNKHAESCTGMPKAWGMMGLTANGKNFFNENLKTISEISNISTENIMHNPELNIFAYAKAFSLLSEKHSIKSQKPADYIEILKELSEIPYSDNNISTNFAISSFLYSVFVFLDNDNFAEQYNFPKYNINLKQIFGNNLKILSAHKVEISEEEISNSKGDKYILTDQKTDCPDYPVSHCSWVSSPNYSSRGGTPVSAIVIHTIQGSYSSCIAWFQNPDANVSTQYVVRSSDGQITQMVLEANKAWHIGSENSYTIGYEHEGYVEEEGWYTPAVYQSSSDLTIDICEEYGISNHRTFFRDTLDDGTAMDYGNHVLAGDTWCTKIAGHQHYPNQTHTDPGPYWSWNHFFKLVNSGLGALTILNDESGTLYDTGGSSGEYSDDERQFWLIQPNDAGQIILNFSTFNIEDNYDFMYIYDGDNVFAPLIGRWNTQSPGTVYSSGGALLVEFRSDCATTATGWEASWTSSGIDTEVPVTSISTSGGDWKTEDFTAYFTDEDNSGIEKAYYQIIEFDGTDWIANNNNGFFADNFDNDLTSQWTESTGSWDTDGGYLHQSDEAVSNTNIYASLTQNLSDRYLYNFIAKATGTHSNKRFGLHFFSDNGSLTNRGNSYFVWFRINDQSLQFFKVIDDVFSLEHTVTGIITELNQVYDFKIIYDRNTGKTDVYRDNALIGSHTFNAPYSDGDFISFRTGNCQLYIDQIKVYRSRPDETIVSVGSEQSNDIRFQNPNQETYSAKVKSIVADYAGNISEIAYYNLDIDYTAPETIPYINDGLSDDIDITSEADQLSANWGNSSDANSGFSNFWISIGTSPGSNNITDYTNNGTSTSATVSGLSLQHNTTYYFNVIAENNAELQTSVISSDGILYQNPLSIDKLKNNIIISPNPFSDIINLKIQGNQFSEINLKLTDIMGKVYKVDYLKSSNEFELLLPQALNSGIYFLLIEIDGISYHNKIVKQ